MQLILSDPFLVWFSQKTDGDLQWLEGQPDQFAQSWNSLDFVTREGLPLPRFAHQIHESQIMHAEESSPVFLQGKADALCTTDCNVPIGVFTADCLPIVLFGKQASAAVHAGWRGTLQNIAGKATDHLIRTHGETPDSICAVLGPCICRRCFEVGNEVTEAFLNSDPSLNSCFTGLEDCRGEKWTMDLRGVNTLQLIRAGLSMEAISHINDCTHCNPEAYFSYRREKKRNGVMFSGITRLGR